MDTFNRYQGIQQKLSSRIFLIAKMIEIFDLRSTLKL